MILATFAVSLFAAPQSSAVESSRTVDSSRTGEPVRLFVFAGQSNMEGADTKATEVERIPSFKGAAKPQPEVRYWYMLGRPGPDHESKGFVPPGPDHRGRGRRTT